MSGLDYASPIKSGTSMSSHGEIKGKVLNLQLADIDKLKGLRLVAVVAVVVVVVVVVVCIVGCLLLLL